MHKLMLTGALLMLTGCAGFGLPFHDPSQAWIDLDSRQEDTTLQALEVDDKAATVALRSDDYHSLSGCG